MEELNTKLQEFNEPKKCHPKDTKEENASEKDEKEGETAARVATSNETPER